MSNVTPMPPPERNIPTLDHITETVIRAKQIVRAVNVALNQGADGEQFQYALDQACDMLDQVGKDLSDREDAERRGPQGAQS